MIFGTFLRKERNKLQLSTQEFANGVGVSKSYIVLIETGKRRPSINLLSKFAEVLHKDVSVLVNIYLKDIKSDIHTRLV